MLTIQDLTFRMAGRVLLEDASVAINAGKRVALVGPNGAGKSTLLKLIQGALQPDQGTIGMPPRWRMGAVSQEAPGGDRSLIATVLAADAERESLMAEAETATDADRIGEIHTRLADIDAHTAEARAATILAGLGFSEADQQRPCKDFSGGMRMRVALAAALFQAPDLLLLDEPTNHLDLEATIWLESYLIAYPHTMVVVSHDRTLLNKVVEETVHLHQCRLTLYQGGYDQFERQRRERQALVSAMNKKIEAKRAHMQAFVDRFRSKATKARQAQSRLKAMAKLEPLSVDQDVVGPRFAFPDPDELPPPLINLDQASVGYGGPPILTGLNMRIDPDDRIALLGANGNGKSTFAKLLAGRLGIKDGRMVASSKLKAGFFAQHQAEDLPPDSTPLAEMKRALDSKDETTVRSRLAGFGLDVRRADTVIRSLSGGEKARLMLAIVTSDAPNLLILDEPTNHLDIESREALVMALNDYKGAVLLITHDPSMIELVADRLWLVAEGKVRSFDGDIDDYRKLLLDQRRRERASARAEAKETSGEGSARKADKRSAADRRAQLAPLRERVKKAEQAIDKLEKAVALRQKVLADPETYKDSGKATEAQIKLSETERLLEAAEEEWMEASEVLASAEA